MAASQKSISSRAQDGFAHSAEYDRFRPAYSPTIVQLLLDNLGVAGRKGAKLVDLAAGTGKLTESLAARDEQFEITAVEPHKAMRDVLIAKNLPGVSVVDGTAESMPSIDSGSIDAVLVAQAFHWFATLPALKEIHRILRRHGAMGLVWNAEDWNSAKDHAATTKWEQAAQDLNFDTATAAGDDEPRFRHNQWRNIFDEQVKKSPLSLLVASDDQMFSLPIAEQQVPFEVSLTREQAWNRYCTLGHIACLDDARKDQVRQKFMNAVNSAEQNEKGEVIVHGSTYALWTTKIPEEGRQGVFNGPESEPVDS